MVWNILVNLKAKAPVSTDELCTLITYIGSEEYFRNPSEIQKKILHYCFKGLMQLEETLKSGEDSAKDKILKALFFSTLLRDSTEHIAHTFRNEKLRLIKLYGLDTNWINQILSFVVMEVFFSDSESAPSSTHEETIGYELSNGFWTNGELLTLAENKVSSLIDRVENKETSVNFRREFADGLYTFDAAIGLVPHLNREVVKELLISLATSKATLPESLRFKKALISKLIELKDYDISFLEMALNMNDQDDSTLKWQLGVYLNRACIGSNNQNHFVDMLLATCPSGTNNKMRLVAFPQLGYCEMSPTPDGCGYEDPYFYVKTEITSEKYFSFLSTIIKTDENFDLCVAAAKTVTCIWNYDTRSIKLLLETLGRKVGEVHLGTETCIDAFVLVKKDVKFSEVLTAHIATLNDRDETANLTLEIIVDALDRGYLNVETQFSILLSILLDSMSIDQAYGSALKKFNKLQERHRDKVGASQIELLGARLCEIAQNQKCSFTKHKAIKDDITAEMIKLIRRNFSKILKESITQLFGFLENQEMNECLRTAILITGMTEFNWCRDKTLTNMLKSDSALSEAARQDMFRHLFSFDFDEHSLRAFMTNAELTTSMVS